MTTLKRDHGELTGSRGLTLVELLVVIAIIGVLAALLLPVLARSKEAAYSTVCKNSLRQRMMGVQLFVNDYGKFPFDLWEVREHLGSNTAWDFCPTVEAGNDYSPAGCCGPVPAYGTDYFYNADGTGALDTSDTRVRLGLGGSSWKGDKGKWLAFRLPESRVKSPANMIAATHVARGGVMGIPQYPMGFGGPGVYQHPLLRKGPLHPNGENAAFVDGHVASEDSARHELRQDGWWKDTYFKPTVASAMRWNFDNKPHKETWLE